MLLIIFSLIFSILIAAFAIQNAGIVAIHFLWYQVDLSQAVIILGSTLIGVLIILPFYLIKVIKHKIKLMELKSELTGLKKEIESLRLPKTEQSTPLNINAEAKTLEGKSNESI